MSLKSQLRRPELQPVPDGKGGWVATPALSGFLATAPMRSRKAWSERHTDAWIHFQRLGLERMEQVARLGLRGFTDDELRAVNVTEAEIRDLRKATPEDLERFVNEKVPALRANPWLTWVGEPST